MRVRTGRTAERGFTLVELIAALTILALLSGGLFAALRFSARAWERGEARIAEASDTAAIRGFLRARLAGLQPVRLTGPGGSEAPAFAGGPNRLRFAAAMPPEVGLGGLYLFTLAQGAETPLLLDWRLIRPEGPVDVADGRQRPRPLFPAETRVRFRYFGRLAGEEEPRWHDRWEAETLPALVEMRFERAAGGRAPPPLRAAPIAAAAASPAR